MIRNVNRLLELIGRSVAAQDFVAPHSKSAVVERLVELYCPMTLVPVTWSPWTLFPYEEEFWNNSTASIFRARDFPPHTVHQAKTPFSLTRWKREIQSIFSEVTETAT